MYLSQGENTPFNMDQIRENVSVLRDSIQRSNFYEISAVDIFTAFYVILQKRVDSSITDDKHFSFLLGVIHKVPQGNDREYFFNQMFSIYEKLSGIDPKDSNWLLLQANLIYLAPIGGGITHVDDRFQY